MIFEKCEFSDGFLCIMEDFFEILFAFPEQIHADHDENKIFQIFLDFAQLSPV